MSEPADTNGDSHNNGKYTMYITVSQPSEGATDRGPGAIKAGENLNPVKTLRMRYDAWRLVSPTPLERAWYELPESLASLYVPLRLLRLTVSAARGALRR